MASGFSMSALGRLYVESIGGLRSGQVTGRQRRRPFHRHRRDVPPVRAFRHLQLIGGYQGLRQGVAE